MKNFIDKLKKTFGFTEDETIEDKTENISAPQEEQQDIQKKKNASSLPVSFTRREDITSFIVNSLKPYVDEKRIAIAGIKLYVLCRNNEEEETARVALHADEPGSFKQDKLERKLVNNFIRLADNWFFEYEFVSSKIPDCKFRSNDYGLDVYINHTNGNRQFTTACVRIITGQAELAEYILDPAKQKEYSIGRGKNPQLSSGRIHTNDIVFLNKEDEGFDEEKGKSNLFVSRNHASVIFNPSLNKFFLYANEGSVPHTASKTKLFKSSNKIERVDIPGVGHELADGDQIELGGEAKLLFVISKD